MGSETTTAEQDDVARARELLRDLRASIDNFDAAIVYLLAERFRATEQVGRLKAAHKLPAADPTREREQIARLRTLAKDAKFNPDFAEKFLNFIVKEVIRHHEAVASGSTDAGLVQSAQS
ncbi:chorismate mutase [Tianweitania sediminis]|jgi:chorismate mutase|uniref:chorismate mutase n=1 Tax=Tianweitania sediminis TaxID=1502156 RepID=A0A8J7QXT4_9HYPH|nr:chorismate mutase [Tianweitania sediminis]MBP0437825.1 chorismate mutase [Tianweitania sediminis]